MIYIISGTDRKGSNSLVLAEQLLSFYKQNNVSSEVLDLQTLPLAKLHELSYNQDLIPLELKEVFSKIVKAKALHIVCPEYNGSYPGALKFFMDYWKFPESFEKKPVAFVGLGGRFAGLRPVEHLMQIFSYRNAILYPQRVFVTNVWDTIKNGSLVEQKILNRLEEQVKGFSQFVDKLH